MLRTSSNPVTPGMETGYAMRNIETEDVALPRVHRKEDFEMARMDLRAMKFAKVYPLYVQKVERKGRTKAELDEVIAWLTGYDANGIEDQLTRETSFETFFDEAPAIPAAATDVKGLICGIRVEDIEDPVVRNVRRLDKLVDELAKGRKMEKIKRG